jgi:N-methylhydantoinase B
VHRDDVVRLVTGSGGGYGDPREREPALVAVDLRDGLVTSAEATEFYAYEPSVGSVNPPIEAESN